MDKLKCVDKIDDMLKDRVKDIKAILKKEDPIDELNSYALALTKLDVYILELSWGGPADKFKFYYNPETRELENIVYIYQEWFDGAEKYITDKEQFEILEDLFFQCIVIE